MGVWDSGVEVGVAVSVGLWDIGKYRIEKLILHPEQEILAMIIGCVEVSTIITSDPNHSI